MEQVGVLGQHHGGSVTSRALTAGTKEQECLMSHDWLNTQSIIAIQSQSFPPSGSAAVRGAKVSGGLASGPPSSV